MHNYLKYIGLVWLILFVLPLGALANEQAEALLKKGNGAYAKNKYEEAAAAYQQVLTLGYQSAPTYFNLGNAHYKLGNMPEAILNYEKALKLTPGDEDIKLNLQLANLKITDRIEEIPEFFLTKWWKAFVFFFAIDTLSIFSVIGFIAGFALLIGYLFLTAVFPKKVAFYSGITILSIALITLMITKVQSHALNTHQQGIVFVGAADVKSGPAAQQKTLFVIHEGTKVSIKDQEADWIKITLANGNGGWIKLADIKEI